jgi:hypothetical protein
MRSTTQPTRLLGAPVLRRLQPLPSESYGHEGPSSTDQATARSLAKLFVVPKPPRAERPWSRLQIEVRREFQEAQRWGRR